MTNRYLNDGFLWNRKSNYLVWENKQNKFSKPEMEYVESLEKRLQYRGRSPYKIQYDYIFIDADNGKNCSFWFKVF